MKKKCKFCEKTLEDNRYDFCNIDCRKAMKLSKPKQRVGIPIMAQDPSYHKNNYLVQKYGVSC